jgi:metabotropic glutamate receptor 5
MLIVAAFVFEPGNVIVDDRTRRYEARLMCANKEWSIIGPIGYNMCLVAMCTFYAVRTRNLPENFNEAKFIGFSMYTTCVIWLAFIPLFFGSDFKVITLCLSTSFSATVILIFLFIPKVYIIIFEPEKNQRSAFATAKEIRCHFGSNVQTSSIDDRY